MINRMTKRLDFSPLVILLLSFFLTVMTGLYAWEKSKNITITQVAQRNNIDQEISRSSNIIPKVKWKLVTSWPKSFPGLGTGPEKLAELVKEMTGGQFEIEVFGAGEIVPALGVFDAVSNGSVQAGHSGAYYWKGKIPASIFFTAIPFGMNAQELNAWLYHGGGIKLWHEAYAPYNLIPFPGGNTGVQMAGWFNKEVNTLSDLKGLRMRIPGLGGEVFKAIGGEPVNIPGGELYTAIQSGLIDATEWIGPYNDKAFGFDKIGKYYYYPGWHEPSANLEFIFNKEAWNDLPQEFRSILQVAAQAVNHEVLNEYTYYNSQTYSSLKDVDIRPLPDDVIKQLALSSQQAIETLVDKDEFAKKVYASYSDFYEKVKQYHSISEHAYLNAR
jgi:TRAP-type mannitol/chloroaromatic compound transport system substrate-binding protein